jgi:hypothetical protein
VYGGSLRATDGRLGAVIAQEMLLRTVRFEGDLLERAAEFLGVTPED